MRSRVNRNKELHQAISNDTESVVESSDLSHFANRLNQIDQQFSRMDVEKQEERTLEHARQYEAPKEEVLDKGPSIKDTEFDTFENAYLKDFLQEVKDYNIKKGYRDIENTSTNIIKELNLDSGSLKSREISEPELVKGTETERIEEVLSDIDQDYTQIYRAVDHVSDRKEIEDPSLEETISMAIQSMDDEEDIEVQESYDFDDEILPVIDHVTLDEEVIEELTDTVEQEEQFVEVGEAEEIKFFEAQDIPLEKESKMTRELLEQTQTLQFKIVDQEKSIEEMGETMVRTNRLLNTTLSLLMLAIVVVLMFIAANILKG